MRFPESIADFIALQKTKADSENSWTLDVSTLDDNFDLSVKNPNKVEVVDNRTPREIAEQIMALNAESNELLKEILEML